MSKRAAAPPVRRSLQADAALAAMKRRTAVSSPGVKAYRSVRFVTLQSQLLRFPSERLLRSTRWHALASVRDIEHRSPPIPGKRGRFYPAPNTAPARGAGV